MLVTNGEYNEFYIREVTLKERSYKNMGSLTPIASFWGVVLPKLILITNGTVIESQPTREGYLQRVLTSGGANRN